MKKTSQSNDQKTFEIDKGTSHMLLGVSAVKQKSNKLNCLRCNTANAEVQVE